MGSDWCSFKEGCTAPLAFPGLWIGERRLEATSSSELAGVSFLKYEDGHAGNAAAVEWIGLQVGGDRWLEAKGPA